MLLHVVDQGRSYLDELNVDVLEGFGGPRARGRATGPRIYGKLSRSSVLGTAACAPRASSRRRRDGVTAAAALFELDNRRTRR